MDRLRPVDSKKKLDSTEFDKFSKMLMIIIISAMVAACVFGGWVVYTLVTWVTIK